MTAARPSVTITISDWTPTLDLSPNGRMHWRAKKRHTDAAKALTLGTIRSWRNNNGYYGNDPIITGNATIRVVIRWEKGRKRMDGDNVIACLKSVVDALQQGGVIRNDRDLTWSPIVQERDRVGRGSVEITIEAIEQKGRTA